MTAFEPNRGFIFRWFRQAINSGAFEEKNSETRETEDYRQSTDRICNSTNIYEAGHRRANGSANPNTIIGTQRLSQAVENLSPDPNTTPSPAPISRNADFFAKNRDLLESIIRRDFDSTIRILNDGASSRVFHKDMLRTALLEVCGTPEIDKNHDVDSVVYDLLKYGAPEGFDGKPPLVQRGKPLVVFAVQCNWSRTLSLLDARPNDLFELKYHSTLTLLQIASVHGSTEAARVLVANGAEIDAISTEGTALMCALRSESNHTARFLVEKGANTMLRMDHSIVSKSGPCLLPYHRTCVGAAIDGGNMIGLRLLFEHGPQRINLEELRLVISTLDHDEDPSEGFPVPWDWRKFLHEAASLLAEHHPQATGYIQKGRPFKEQEAGIRLMLKELYRGL